MSSINWDASASLIPRGDRALVLARGGREAYLVTGLRAQLLSRCWGTQGPDSETAQWYLRSSGQLVIPIWNELLAQLISMRVVTAPGATGAAVAPVWNSPWVRMRVLFDSRGRQVPGASRAWLYLSLSVLSVVSALALVQLTQQPIAPRVDKTLWFKFLVHPDFFVAALLSGLGLFTGIQWVWARRLGAYFEAVPALGLVLWPYPHLSARRELGYALTPQERGAVSGLLLLAQGVLLLLACLGMVFWPSAPSAGVAMGVAVAVLLDLYPFWRSNGAALWEAVLNVEDFTQACLDNFVYQWMPSSYQSRALQSLRDVRSYRIGLVALLSFSATMYATGQLFDAVMGAPGLHARSSLARAIWFVLAGGIALSTVGAWLYAVGLIVHRWFVMQRPGAIKAVRLSPERRALAARMLRETSLLADIPVKVVDQLLDSAQAFSFRDGAVLIVEGDVGDSFWLVVEGAVKVEKARAEGEPLQLAILAAGAGIGEIALLENMRRTATVRAASPGLALKLPGSAFAEWMVNSGMDARTLRYRVRVGQVVNSAAFFAGLPRAVGADLIRVGRARQLAAGEQFVRQGDTGDRLWIVLDGQVEVTRQGQKLAVLGSGNVVGEMALLSGNPRSADVSAVNETLLLEITASDFWAMLEKYPALREAAELQVRKRQQP